MSQVFLSYASADRERARRLADAMTQRGYRVWWDRQIAPGQTFDEVIERELDESACVVVLWSSTSIKSQWVKTEAAEAASRRILVPVRIDDVRIPLEFRRLQAADLTQWNGDAGSPEFEQFLRAVDHELLEHREALAEAPTMSGHVSAAAAASMPASMPGAVAERAASTAQSAPAAIAAVAAGAPAGSRTGSSGRWAWIAASVAVAGLAGATVAWVMMGRNQETPSVAGIPYEQAVATLSAAGLTPDRREQPSTTDAPGQVIAQSPPAGTLLARGSVVSLTVAVAPLPPGETSGDDAADSAALEPPAVAALATIPDLRGQTAERAGALLTAAELTIGATVEAAANDAAIGTVVAQDPAPSQAIAKGSSVQITVATRRITPEVTGLNLLRAQEQLTTLGLSPRIARVRAGRRDEDDRVLRQAPAAGSELVAGGEVEVVVATVAPKRVNGGEPLLYTTPRRVPERCAKACQDLGLRWTREWSGTANTCTCDLETPR